MTATTCQTCGGRATDAFLCRNCQAELRDMLKGLPQWIEYLAEAAIGQTNLGGDGGRYTRSEPDGLIQYTDEGEGQNRLERDIAAGKLGIDRILAAGGVNPRASRLLDAIQNSLTTIVRSLLETKGVELPPDFAATGRATPNGSPLAANLARWLTSQLSAISLDESAGQIHAEITAHIHDIERTINRPIPPRFCGPCPTTVEHDRCHTQGCTQRHPHPCANRLMAKRTAIEVTCRTCGQTHNVETLIKRLLADVDHWRFTYDEILQIMDMLGETLNKRTFRHWRATAKVKPSGYRSPDGRRITINRHNDDDDPLYRLSDVRRLRNTGEVMAG